MVDPDIARHYEGGAELGRLDSDASAIEFARTKEILERYLPPPPARVIDVGGGPGAYAAWLAEHRYDVHLVDPVPLHVEKARPRGGFSVALGDARRLDEPEGSADVVLLLGPLYHLTERRDRVLALREARRVLRPGGLVAAAAISRFASLFDGLFRGYVSDRVFRAITERDLADGQHRSPPGGGYFTTAYFHHPHELAAEVADAGLELGGVFGVEGPGWLLAERWDDDAGREDILRAARAIEQEPGLLGVSAHLLVVARVPLG